MGVGAGRTDDSHRPWATGKSLRTLAQEDMLGTMRHGGPCSPYIPFAPGSSLLSHLTVPPLWSSANKRSQKLLDQYQGATGRGAGTGDTRQQLTRKYSDPEPGTIPDTRRAEEVGIS